MRGARRWAGSPVVKRREKHMKEWKVRTGRHPSGRDQEDAKLQPDPIFEVTCILAVILGSIVNANTLAVRASCFSLIIKSCPLGVLL